MNIGQIIVIGLSLLWALWLAGGIWYNRRRRRQIWRWLEPGLDALGGRVSVAWLGALGAGLHATIDNPLAPLRRVQVIIRLASRENLPYWLFELAQGRRDQLTLRAWLRSPARGELEAIPAGSALDRALQTQADPPWQRTSASPGWAIAQRGSVREEQVAALREFVTAYSRQLQHFSQRRSEPHLFVQMSLGELTDEPSRQLLGRVKATLTA